MPGPTASSIIKARWTVRVILRSVAAALLVAAFAWAVIRIEPWRAEHSMAAGGFAPTPRIVDLAFFGYPISLAIAALASLLIGQFAIKWIVFVPKPICPSCGYGLSKPEGPRCTECGLQIGENESAS